MANKLQLNLDLKTLSAQAFDRVDWAEAAIERYHMLLLFCSCHAELIAPLKVSWKSTTSDDPPANDSFE
jgi:hypothetical protein